MNNLNSVGTQCLITNQNRNYTEAILIVKATPFVKWAGGKRQLLSELDYSLPKTFNNYFEPFVGGGALFFHLKSKRIVNKAILNDYNPDLVGVYKIVKNDVNALIKELASLKYKNNEETFYQIRKEQPSQPVKKAAQFLYLNKTAFNGLYRVNSKGKFNVPFGKYKNPKILDEKNLLAVSKALQIGEITCLDFEQAIEKAKKEDFVYFDPPYQPISKTSNFTSYTTKDFTEKDQERLSQCFKKLDKKGCFVMLSNSYVPLIKELYKEFNQKIVMAGRTINCNGNGRGKIKELLITNY